MSYRLLGRLDDSEAIRYCGEPTAADREKPCMVVMTMIPNYVRSYVRETLSMQFVDDQIKPNGVRTERLFTTRDTDTPEFKETLLNMIPRLLRLVYIKNPQNGLITSGLRYDGAYHTVFTQRMQTLVMFEFDVTHIFKDRETKQGRGWRPWRAEGKPYSMANFGEYELYAVGLAGFAVALIIVGFIFHFCACHRCDKYPASTPSNTPNAQSAKPKTPAQHQD